MWSKSDEYKRIQEILNDYWLNEPNEKQVQVVMTFQHMDGSEQTKSVVWRNPNVRPDPSKRTRKQNTMQDYYKAGAMYRLWKEISVMAANELSRITQNAKATDSLYYTANAIGNLEHKLGFESCLERDHSELPDKDFCSMFYGSIGVNRKNETDSKINEYVQESLRNLMNKTIDTDTNEESDVLRIRKKKPRMRSANDNDILLKINKSGTLRNGKQRYAVILRFSKHSKEMIANNDYVEFAYHKKTKRLYIIPSNKEEGYCISSPTTRVGTYYVQFTDDGNMPMFSANVGKHPLKKDVVKNLCYIELNEN